MFMKYRHSFATSTVILNHFVHHEIRTCPQEQQAEGDNAHVTDFAKT